MGIAISHGRIQAHHPEQVRGLVAIFVPAPGHTMDHQGLADNVGDLHPRVQGAEGILKDDLHPSAQLPDLSLVDSGDILPFEKDLSPRRTVKLQQGIARSGLAAAAFSHQAQGFALQDGKTDPVHGLDVADLLFE